MRTGRDRGLALASCAHGHCTLYGAPDRRSALRLCHRVCSAGCTTSSRAAWLTVAAMKVKHLESHLERVELFAEPKVALEQVQCSPSRSVRRWR